jgi:hypothetical protein
MALQQWDACPRKYIVYSSNPISWSSGKFIPCRVKASIQNFVIMASKSLNALPTWHIPQFASPVNASSQAVVSSKVKLTTAQLSSVAF